MAYNIHTLGVKNLEKRLYFFDANLWLKILKPPFNLSKRDERYLAFFEKFKASDANPKIAVTSLLLSEVINRYLREVSMNRYINKNSLQEESKNRGFYKENYRKSNQFAIDYVLLCDDIKSFHRYIHLIPDDLGNGIKLKHLFNSPPKGLDYNDFYYYLLAQKHNLVVITDDVDFFVEGVEVHTLNQTLINKYRDQLS